VPEPQTASAAPAVLYWEERAQRFARRGAGLAAVCSYGMPAFYNRLIDVCQHLALRRWLRTAPSTRVLDVGCGVGRWSRRLAARGAHVTGIDLSPTMIAEARRRARAQPLRGRCQFLVQDVHSLRTDEKFDLVLSVTVLQHILEAAAVRAALQRMADTLAEGGALVLLEASPRRPVTTCDSAVFRARPRGSYLQLFADCGLEVRAVRGVDPAPFKTWLLPYLPRLSPQVRLAALALVTVLSLPIDLVFGRRAAGPSWHTVFVLGRARDVHAH
jgi:SAM-dependent methyltransferase